MLRVTCGCHYVTGAKFNMIVPRLGGYPSKMETVYYLATDILWKKCNDSEISMKAAVRHISVQMFKLCIDSTMPLKVQAPQ